MVKSPSDENAPSDQNRSQENDGGRFRSRLHELLLPRFAKAAHKYDAVFETVLFPMPCSATIPCQSRRMTLATRYFCVVQGKS